VAPTQEARRELEAVKSRAPKEPTVYLQIGRVCKALVRGCRALFLVFPQFMTLVSLSQKDYDAAIRYLNIALDLDPKDPNQIKVAFERCQLVFLSDVDSYVPPCNRLRWIKFGWKMWMIPRNCELRSRRKSQNESCVNRYG
jgi:tetratricopeptide (TPR) repeat protein